MNWHPRITFYRLTVILSTIWLGTAKAVCTYQGREFISITIDWIMGVVIYLLWVPTTKFSIALIKTHLSLILKAVRDKHLWLGGSQAKVLCMRIQTWSLGPSLGSPRIEILLSATTIHLPWTLNPRNGWLSIPSTSSYHALPLYRLRVCIQLRYVQGNVGISRRPDRSTLDGLGIWDGSYVYVSLFRCLNFKNYMLNQ